MKTPNITQEEIGIIKDAKAGKTSAFNKLFKRYKSFVESILYSYIKDMDEAKEITNIVFLKVYYKLSTFSEYNTFGGWLRIITQRTAIDYLRKIKVNEIELKDNSVRLTQEISSTNTENDLVNHMTYTQILKLLDKLPDNTKHICKLFYEDNMTIAEISKTLSIPIGTIKSILFRMRKQLKTLIK